MEEGTGEKESSLSAYCSQTGSDYPSDHRGVNRN